VLETLFAEQASITKRCCAIQAGPRQQDTLHGRAGKRHPQQILRVDREDRRALEPAIERQLIAAILDQVESHAAILVSDYAKGLYSWTHEPGH